MSAGLIADARVYAGDDQYGGAMLLRGLADELEAAEAKLAALPKYEYVGQAFEHGGFMRYENRNLTPDQFEDWRKLTSRCPRVEILRRRKAGPWERVEGES